MSSGALTPGANSTSAPASWYACSRAMVSSRSRRPWRKFSARAVSTRCTVTGVRGLGRGGDPLDREPRVVDGRVAVAGEVLHRCAGQPGGDGATHRLGHARGIVGEAVLEVGGHGHVDGVDDRRGVARAPRRA